MTRFGCEVDTFEDHWAVAFYQRDGDTHEPTWVRRYMVRSKPELTNLLFATFSMYCTVDPPDQV